MRITYVSLGVKDSRGVISNPSNWKKQTAKTSALKPYLFDAGTMFAPINPTRELVICEYPYIKTLVGIEF